MAVRPLKRSSGGLPREVNVTVDDIALKAIDLEGLGTHIVRRNLNDIEIVDPNVGTVTVDLIRSTSRVSFNDTTPNYLVSKIVAGTNIAVNELNDGLDETLEIASTQVFGEDSAFDQTDGPILTTSGTFVTVFTVPFTVTASPSGTYRLGWNAKVITSKSNTVGEHRLVVDAGLASEIILATGSSISTFESTFTGFDSGIIDNGPRTIDFQVRRAAGNGTVDISDLSAEVWRVL